MLMFITNECLWTMGLKTMGVLNLNVLKLRLNPGIPWHNGGNTLFTMFV